MDGPSAPVVTPSDDDVLVSLAHALRRRWRLILAILVPLLLGTALYAFSLPDDYEAQAVVTLAPRLDTDARADIVRLLLPRYAVFATSPTALGAVADSTALSVEHLEENVEVELPPESANLSVTVTARRPGLAADAANALVAEVIEFAAEDPLLEGLETAAAQAPAHPSGPPQRLYLLAAGTLGLLLGSAAALLAERWRPRLDSRAAIGRVAGLPVLTSIPARRDARRTAEPALAHPDIGLPIFTLRSAVRHLMDREDGGVVVVTAAASSHGTSTVASLLATSVADLDEGVLLVEANLQRPDLHHRLDLPPDDGLVRALDDGQPASHGRLASSGVTALLASSVNGALTTDQMLRSLPRFAQVVREQQRLTIVDAPPLNEGDLAASLTQVADGVLLVVPAGVEREELETAVATLRRLHAHILGIVVNGRSTTLRRTASARRSSRQDRRTEST